MHPPLEEGNMAAAEYDQWDGAILVGKGRVPSPPCTAEEVNEVKPGPN